MQAIGNTLLVQLIRLHEKGAADIFVKWEGANPTGSSLAMVCAAKGYRGYFVSSDAFAEEKIRTMRAFGSTVEVTPSVNRMVTPELIQSLIKRVAELAAEPNTFWTDQFNNPDNRAGYTPMAREIMAALGGRFDEFIQGVGTGGSFSGNAEVFKRQVPGVYRGGERRGRLCDGPPPRARGGRLRGHLIGGQRVGRPRAGAEARSRPPHRHDHLRFGAEISERGSVSIGADSPARFGTSNNLSSSTSARVFG